LKDGKLLFLFLKLDLFGNINYGIEEKFEKR